MLPANLFMNDKTRKLLFDVLDSGHAIREWRAGRSFDEYFSDRKFRRAVEREFEIIGEAANRLPEEFKDHHSEIDWHKIRGFRNRIVHDYFGIDYSIVWEIKNNFLQPLIQKLKSIQF